MPEQEQPQVTVVEIPAGEEGTKKTVEAIIEMAEKGAMDFEVITLAREITRPAPPRDYEQMADMVFWWIKQNIKFVNDPAVGELIQSPIRTIKARAADCDCMVTLMSSLLLSVGIPARFVTIASDDDNPDEYSHIYLQADVGGASGERWKSYDTATDGSYPGWVPPRYHRIEFWEGRAKSLYLRTDMGSWFSSAWKKIKKEIERAARRLKEEIERATNKVNAELTRMEGNFGPFGKMLAFGAKVAIGGALTVITGGAAAGVLSVFTGMSFGGVAGAALTAANMGAATPFARFIAVESFESPWKLSEEEWIMLAKLAAAISSAVLFACSGGAAAPLLASSVISITNTLRTAYELQGQIEQRKEIIAQLKAANAKIEFEKRVQREAINKLEADIRALEWYMTRSKEIELELLQYQESLKQALEEENAMQTVNFQIEIENYKAELQEETDRLLYPQEYQYSLPQISKISASSISQELLNAQGQAIAAIHQQKVGDHTMSMYIEQVGEKRFAQQIPQQIVIPWRTYN